MHEGVEDLGSVDLDLIACLLELELEVEDLVFQQFHIHFFTGSTRLGGGIVPGSH